MYPHQDKALNEHLRNFAIYDCIQYYFHCKHEVAALLAVENEHNVKVPFADLISEHLKQMIAHKSPVLNPLILIGNMKFTKKSYDQALELNDHWSISSCRHFDDKMRKYEYFWEIVTEDNELITLSVQFTRWQIISIKFDSDFSRIEKDSVNNAELVRWLITYQNFTGVTDKTKVKSKDKFSVSPGWLYSINPVYIKGKTLFDTLMLNLSLVTNDSADGTNWLNSQRPVWEYDDINDYLQQRLNGVYPDNLSELYTVWSRMIHIDWQNGQPVIFSAGLPKLDSEKQFLEPMTTWRKNKDGVVYPAAKNKDNINVAMWRNFGQYIRTKANEDEKRIPGIVSWIQELKKEKYISKHTNINIATVAMISDGNATSQSPYAEITDNMQAKAGVLFDDEPMLENRWQDRIEKEVLLTQQVANYFYWFAKDISNIQTHSEKKKSNDDWASRKVAQFYDELNQPFYTWLSGLDLSQDRDAKTKEWRETLNRFVATQAKNIFINATADEIIGGKEDNIFTIYNKLRRNVYVCLGLK